MLYQLKEWQSPSGMWYCNCIDNLAGGSGKWYLPARILNLSPANYIKWVVTNYKPDYIYTDKEKCLFFISWSDQVKMRSFKNYINKEAKKINFQI